LTRRSADAVRAGIAAADNDDVLAVRGDGCGAARTPQLVLLRRKSIAMDSSSSRPEPRDPPLGVSGHPASGPRGKRSVEPDLVSARKITPGLHLLVDGRSDIVHLEVGDAAQQTADAIALSSTVTDARRVPALCEPPGANDPDPRRFAAAA
jgi:hypothetical protein